MEKRSTKDKLIQSAIDLFYEKWYDIVSVADICRNANLSNGIFYRYYKNKEEIFKNIVGEFISIVEKELNDINTNSVENGINQFISALYNLTKKYKKQITIFREGQYRYYEYEIELRNIYYKKITEIYNRELSIVEYIYILSGLRFLTIRFLYGNLPFNHGAINKIITNGIFETPVKNIDTILDMDIVPLNLNIEENTKEKLLKAGRKLFGDKGYHHVNIYEITNHSNIGVGTFYNYFESKELFFREIIRLISKDIRKFISKNINNTLSRIEQELQGIYLFSLFLNIDPTFYNIVREGEFVVNETVKEYYNSFEEGYIHNLKETKIQDHRTSANYLMGISHFLGIEIAFTHSVKDVKKIIKELGKYLYNGINK